MSLLNGLVCYYNFESGNGTNLVNNNVDLDLSGAAGVSVSSISALLGTKSLYNSSAANTGEYTTNVFSTLGQNPCTISFWFNPSSLTSGRIVRITNDNSAAFTVCAGISLYVSGSTYGISFDLAGENYTFASPSSSYGLSVGKWSHVAITYSLGIPVNVGVYLNGTMIQSPTVSYNMKFLWAAGGYKPKQLTLFGSKVYNPMVGYVDEFMLFSRALTTPEVMNLYNLNYFVSGQTTLYQSVYGSSSTIGNLLVSSGGISTNGPIKTNNENINAGLGTIICGNLVIVSSSAPTVSNMTPTIGSTGTLTCGAINTNNNNINLGSGNIYTTGNIHAGTVCLKGGVQSSTPSPGLYWTYGASRIHDNGTLTIESDDSVNIMLNSTSSGGTFNVYSVNTNTYGPIKCGAITATGAINCGAINTNSNNVSIGGGSLLFDGGGKITNQNNQLTITSDDWVDIVLNGDGASNGAFRVYSNISKTSYGPFFVGAITCGEINLPGLGRLANEGGQLIITSDDFVDVIISNTFRVYTSIQRAPDPDGKIECGSIRVNGTSGAFNRTGAYSYLTINSVGYVTDIANYAIYSAGRIGCAAEVNVWSDKRIKRDIQDIRSEDALNIILNLTPKKYNYVDFTKNTQNKDSIGFIAQDVLESFPEAVSKATDWIPNMYDIGTLVEPDVIELKNKKTGNFEISQEQEFLNIKLKLFVNNTEQIVYVKEFLDETRFRLSEPITTIITDNSLNQVFVYGQEVDNLLTLEKNAIFTMAVGSIKKLHEDMQDMKTQMKKMQEQIDQILDNK